MLTINELLHEVEQLPAAEKQQFFIQMTALLEWETQRVQPSSNYQEFLRQTYGILKDDPIEGWEDG